MDKVEALNEVNRLVATGLRKPAIDIIQEYLEKIPNDSVMLRALGRIYLLEKKPDLAVKYLQLSLKSNHIEVTKKDTNESYEFDDLNADDLTYIDETADSADCIYAYSSENTLNNLVDTLIQTSYTANHSLLPTHILFDKETDTNDNSTKDQLVTKIINTSVRSNSIVGDVDKERNIAPATNFGDKKKVDPSHGQADLFSTFISSVTISENWKNDTFTDDEEISLDVYELDEFEIDEDVSLIISEVEDVLIEKEFGWDEFDDIDEQENFGAYFDAQVTTDGRLDRWERANQIAIKVIHTYDWGSEHIPLLQQIFHENGWASARKSIEQELAKGLTPEELTLALYIRSLWGEKQQYWISFLHISSNQTGQETRAAYKNMSWPESLRIIRSFYNVPSEEEIELFIEQIYDDWYSSATRQRQFKTFIRYLKYRTGSVRRSLPGNEIFSFVDSYDKESLLDSGYDLIKYSTGIETLKQEQVDIEQILTCIEQKYTVIRLEGNYGDPEVYGDR